MHTNTVFLQDYPLSQKGLEQELSLCESGERLILFFDSCFPWSSDRAVSFSWTYPEQIFPRLAKKIHDEHLLILPGVSFPQGVPFLSSDGVFAGVLTASSEHPQPVWNLLEEAVIDLMSLCTWSSECFIRLPEHFMDSAFFEIRTDRLYKEQNIKLSVYTDNGEGSVPNCLQKQNSFSVVDEMIKRNIHQAWNIVRLIRESAFKSLSRPISLFVSLEENISLLEKSNANYSEAAGNLLDEGWVVSRYLPAICALKEEYSLLNARFMQV